MDNNLNSIINRINNNKKDTDNFYNTNYNELNNYFKNNKEDIFNHMDLLLKYTSYTNMNYLLDNSVITNDKFYELFFKNLHNLTFKKNIIYILESLRNSYKNKEEYQKLFSKTSIDYLLNDINEFNPEIFNYIYHEINNKSIREYLFKGLINNNFTISNIYPIDEDFFIKYLDKICLLYDDLFKLKNQINYNKELVNKLNIFINNNEDSLIKSILNNIGVEKDEYFTLIKFIIKDIIKNEKCLMSDLTISKKGNFNTVIFINDKVLKISKNKEVEKLIDNEFIIRPLLRKKYKDIFIEVTERVETNIEIKDNDLYDFYKKVRNEGLIYTDIKEDNVGYLLKDNKIYFNGINQIDNRQLNIKDNNEINERKKGELIIIDNDHIYDENDENIKFPSIYSRNFEIKFLKELRQLINNIKDIDYEDKIRLIKENGFKPEYVFDKIKNDSIIFSLDRYEILNKGGKI